MTALLACTIGTVHVVTSASLANESGTVDVDENFAHTVHFDRRDDAFGGCYNEIGV